MTKGQRLIASMLAVIAILLAANLLQGPSTAVASPQTGPDGPTCGWGIAVDQDAWAVVKGGDGRAYIVTPSGWRTAESVEVGRRGPLQLY